jgi:WD40 repeat protein
MTFLCADETGTIGWYDILSRSMFSSWEAHGREINQIACGGDRLCIGASRDQSLSLWRLPAPGSDGSASASGSVAPVEVARRSRAHTLNVSCCDISDDGTIAVSGSKDTFVCTWDPNSGLERTSRASAARNTVTCLKLLPDSTAARAVVAQGSEDLRVRLWDCRAMGASSGAKAVLTLHSVLEGYVYFPLGIDVHENGRYVLTSSRGVGGLGGEARVWDLRNGSRPIAAASTPAEPQLPSIDFESVWGLDGSRGAGVVSKGTRVGEYEGHTSDAGSCCWVPQAVCDSTGIPSGSFVTASTDSTVRLWSVREGSDGHARSAGTGESAECVSRYVDPDTKFSSMAWAGNSDALVVGSHGGGYSVLRPVDGLLKLAALSADDHSE